MAQPNQRQVRSQLPPLPPVQLLPNAAALAQNFRNAADEIERFQNLSNLDVANALNRLLTAVGGMTTQITALTTQVTQMETGIITRIDNSIAALETRLNARMEAIETRMTNLEKRVVLQFQVM